MEWAACEHRVVCGFSPLSFRFYERLLETFPVSIEGLGGAFAPEFRFMVAAQEWISWRFVW